MINSSVELAERRQCRSAHPDDEVLVLITVVLRSIAVQLPDRPLPVWRRHRVLLHCSHMHMHHVNGHCPARPGSAGSPMGPPHPAVSQENFRRLVERGSEQARCPSCHQTISVKALKGTQGTDPNQCPGLILSSSITGLTDGSSIVL